MSNALELAMDTLDSDASSDRKEKARATIREMVHGYRPLRPLRESPESEISLVERLIIAGMNGPGDPDSIRGRIDGEMDALPQTAVVREEPDATL